MLPVDAEETGFPFARSIIKTRTENLKEPGARPAERYFISSHSVEETSAQRFGQLTRGHWNIENGSHWQRDTLWGEDGHLMRQHRGAHILSTLRQLALCLHTLEAAAEAKKPQRIKHRAHGTRYNLTPAIRLINSPLRE